MKSYKLEKILGMYNIRAGGVSSATPCACVHGEHGTGKTELLSEFCDTLLKSGVNVFFSVSKGSDGGGNRSANGSANDCAIRELLRQLARMYGDNHNKDFLTFVDAYVKGSLADGIDGGTVKSYEKDAIIKFIYDCVKTEPIVFIVDDLDMSDSFTIELLGNLIRINALQFLVFSHTDKLQNSVLTDMLYCNAERIEYVELRPDLQLSTSPVTQQGKPDFVFPDEAMLVLKRPGNERQLARHYLDSAKRFSKQLAFDRAAETLGTALSVLAGIKSSNPDDFSPENAALEFDVLVHLGDVLFSEKKYLQAVERFNQALIISDILESRTGLSITTERRVAVFVRLAECYSRQNLQDRSREQIMLAEAFFCTPENRARYSHLYALHIPNYLCLLSELDEKVIFREKLKQAYICCAPDDMEFTGVLYCEEAFMCMETEEFDKAYQLLTDALKLAEMQGSDTLWDEAAGSLGICCEQMGKTDESETLWRELIKRSYNPVKVAEAMVNIAVMQYRFNGDFTAASSGIGDGIELCILAGEELAVSNICENLKDTPLEVAVKR